MIRGVFGWLARNLSTLLISFLLAVVVWVSAVITEDPNRQLTSRAIEIQIIGQDPNLLVVGDLPRQARLTLQAPQSIWDQLNNNPTLMRAWIDLSGLEAGEHIIAVQTRVNASPVRTIDIDPDQVAVTLEALERRTVPVELELRGSLPLGYQQSSARIDPLEVVVSGPASRVQQVARVRALVNISGSTSDIQEVIPIDSLNSEGLVVEGVTVSPNEVVVEVPVNLLGGFKNVAVKVVSTGQVSNGYRLTNITVSPPTVTLFSDNPNLIQQIPGFVETVPVDISGLTDDLEMAVGLDLPPGVSLVREPNVLVQVNVAAIEGTMTVAAPVEVIGLEENLAAEVSPQIVDVIVSGPINELEALTADDFRVLLDLTGLPEGIYQRQVVVDQYPEGMHVQTTLPESVEVTIRIAPTPTATPLGGPPTATPTPTSTPTLTPTPTPTRIILTPTRTPSD